MAPFSGVQWNILPRRLLKAELWVHNGRSVLNAAAQSVCPAWLRPHLSAHSPPSTHPTPVPPQGQLKGRSYERTCSPRSQKFPPWPLPTLRGISLMGPRPASSPSIQGSAHFDVQRLLSSLVSCSFSLIQTPPPTHTHKHTHTFKERGEVPENQTESSSAHMQTNRGAPKSEHGSLAPNPTTRAFQGSGKEKACSG